MSGSGPYRTRGQQAALAVVARAVRAERAPHALLLSGPPRVGKTTLALDLAAGLLCQAEEPGMRPCRECVACRKVESAAHPDVHRLAPEGAGQQIRLGQVQALAGELALLPLEGRCRLAIVEHAQRLNDDAQNALLKTLEEPPARVTIVLCADEPAGLLPTVVSRCARLRLGPVAPGVIAELLAERAGLDQLRGEALGRLSGGMVGAALDLAGQPELLLARDRIVRGVLDLLDADRRARLGAASGLIEDGAEIAAGSSAPAADEAADEGQPTTPKRGRSASRAATSRAAPAERRAAVAHVLGIWRELARDLAIAARGGASELRQRELVDELQRAGQRTDAPAMAAFVERLDAISRGLESYANPELALDVLLLEWPRTEGRGRTRAA